MVTERIGYALSLYQAQEQLTASTRSPEAAIYVAITCGVIILLVGSFTDSGVTSTGRRASVRARSRRTSSKK
jgi:hypothetical protein